MPTCQGPLAVEEVAEVVVIVGATVYVPIVLVVVHTATALLRGHARIAVRQIAAPQDLLPVLLVPIARPAVRDADCSRPDFS